MPIWRAVNRAPRHPSSCAFFAFFLSRRGLWSRRDNFEEETMRRTVLILMSSAACQLALAVPSAESRIQALETQVKGLLATQKQLLEGLGRLNTTYQRLRGVRGVADRIQYPINDQHDNVTMNLLETNGDAETNQIDLVANRIHLQAVEAVPASIPEQTLMEERLQVKLNEWNVDGIAHHQETLRTKLKSLDALSKGAVVEFARQDRATNYEQMLWFEFELKKVRATAELKDWTYHNIHTAYLQGGQPWGSDHSAKQAADEAHATVRMWEAKYAEQKKQYETADRVWREFSASPPVE